MNSHSAGNQFRPKITELTNGNIVVSWSSFETPNNYPGKNNSNDVSIIANHDNASHDYFVQFTDDTSSGMVRPYTAGGGVDPTLDPNSKIEIMGREYTVSQGTVTAKTTNLQNQLANNGITSTIRNVGSPGVLIWKLKKTPLLTTSKLMEPANLIFMAIRLIIMMEVPTIMIF